MNGFFRALLNILSTMYMFMLAMALQNMAMDWYILSSDFISLYRRHILCIYRRPMVLCLRRNLFACHMYVVQMRPILSVAARSADQTDDCGRRPTSARQECGHSDLRVSLSLTLL